MTSQIPSYDYAMKLIMLTKDYYQLPESSTEFAWTPHRSRLHWNYSEKKVFFESHHRLGNDWAKIAEYLPQKTENIIKAYYYSNISRLCRKIRKSSLLILHSIRSKLTLPQIFHLLECLEGILAMKESSFKTKRKNYYQLEMLDTRNISFDLIEKNKQMVMYEMKKSQLREEAFMSTCNIFAREPDLLPAHERIQNKFKALQHCLAQY